MALNEGQIITYLIDEVVNTVDNLTPMAQKVSKYQPPAADMQRSQNTFWMPVEQEAPTQRGWDLTGKETGLLELSIECNLSDPDNDFFKLQADDVRDERSLRRRINASAKKLANNVETSIAQLSADMGSLVISSASAIGPNEPGWNFIAEAEELMFSRELNRNAGLTYFFNPSDYRRAGQDLTNKNFYGAIIEEAYRKGTIQKQVAGFDDVMRSPKLPTLAASASTGATVTGTNLFKPQAWTTDADGNRKNVDNRVATIPVSDTTGFKRGDKISFTGVKFLSQMAKNVLTKDATFTVVSVVDGTHLQISPKPVALADSTLLPEEKAYANVNIGIPSGGTINILNTTDAQTNVFWADDSIVLCSQPIPVNHQLFSGMKVESFNIPGVGISGVAAYQGNIGTFAGSCRIALWYAPVAKRPEAMGVGLPSQA